MAIKEKVLIIGANGKTGRLLVEKLKGHDIYSPVAMIRDEKQAEFFEQFDVETVMGDLEKDLNHVFKDIDKVIFAAGSGAKTGKTKPFL